MKHLLLSLLLLISNNCLILAQAPVWEVQWDKKAGGSEEDIIGTFLVTPDNGFILCGTSFSGISGDKTQPNHDTTFATSDFWLVKTDSSGNILWDKRYGGILNEILTEAISTADGGYLSGGQSFSGISGDKTISNRDTTLLSNDYWIIKTDSSGNTEWDQRYGGTSYEILGSVRQVADGGFIITGSSFSGADGDKTEPSRGGWDYWMVRTDASGLIIWDRRFGGLNDDFSNSIVLTSDGNYLVAGYSNSGTGGDKSEANQGSYDYWIIKVDDSGNKIWDKTFGGNRNDWCFALSTTSDGGFIFGGQSYSEATGDKTDPNHEPAPSGSDRWLVKTDMDGNKIWDLTIGGTEADDLSRIVPTPDGGFLLSGESYSDIGGDKTETNLGPEQTWIVKIDSSGLLLWDKTLLTYGHDESGSALPLGGDCFVAVNFTQADTGGIKSETGWGNGDYWMVKMCDAATLSTSEIPYHGTNWLSYPNPFSNAITLYSESSFQDVTIQLFDVSGKLVNELRKISGSAGKSINIDSSGLQQGIYLCRIIEAKTTTNFRIVKTG